MTIMMNPASWSQKAFSNESGALSLVEIVEILFSDWLNLTMLAPRSMISCSCTERIYYIGIVRFKKEHSISTNESTASGLSGPMRAEHLDYLDQ